MDIPNTDLLPPLFDQVLTHYGENIIAPYGRREIINILANEIVNVAVDRQRSAEMVPGYDGSQDAAVELTTFDRLSGEHLSRADLSEKLQMTLSLNKLVIEIALLLVEAQIDL